MTRRLLLSLVAHAHQPVGNFDFVIEEAARVSYRPFLEVIERHPDLPWGLHYSGCLLDRLADLAPDIAPRVAALARRGQVELLGSGDQEPILVMLRETDRQGQLAAMSARLEQSFAARSQGVWLTERVWEPALAASLARSGARYTLLDDDAFRPAGFSPTDLKGPLLTEDSGHLLVLFPIDKHLRYAIPFHELDALFDYLRQRHADGTRHLTFGDDLEKFGLWPGTNRRCYAEGWLEGFLGRLRAASDWLELVTPAAALSRLGRLPRVQLPGGSYPEMGEWALPVAEQRQRAELLHERPGASDFAPRLRPGVWRAFRARYEEIARQYARSVEVSRRLEHLAAGHDAQPAWRAARAALYRGQCNCAYWHGCFGGAYLPHLRDGIWRNLLAADRQLDALTTPHRPSIESADLDLDGLNEFRLAGRELRVVVQPHRGGRIIALEDRGRDFLWTNVFARRDEAYHDKLARALSPEEAAAGSIHDRVVTKEPGLSRFLIHDEGPLDGLQECLGPGEGQLLSSEAVWRVREQGEIDGTVRLALEVELEQAGARLLLRKTFELAGADAPLRIVYALAHQGGEALAVRWGLRFHFSLLAGDAPDRYYEGDGGARIGTMAFAGRVEGLSALSLVDAWQRRRLTMAIDRPAAWDIAPVYTVAMSEAGFERLYQASRLRPAWDINLRPGDTWGLVLRLGLEDLVIPPS